MEGLGLVGEVIHERASTWELAGALSDALEPLERAGEAGVEYNLGQSQSERKEPAAMRQTAGLESW